VGIVDRHSEAVAMATVSVLVSSCVGMMLHDTDVNVTTCLWNTTHNYSGLIVYSGHWYL